MFALQYRKFKVIELFLSNDMIDIQTCGKRSPLIPSVHNSGF
jgi:hypothetical protein